MEQEVKRSTDYLKFQKIEGNRPISKTHLESLVNSIKQKDLLRLRPIIVDNEFRVLDGQHRLEAARECQVPIYYIVCDSEKFKEITRLNQNQKNWKLVDFLNFFSLNFKNENYIKISNLMEQYKINLENVLIYMDVNFKVKKNREEFCNGDFIFDHDISMISSKISDWKCFYDLLESKNSDYLEFTQNLHFRRALVEILSSSKINRQQFWDRVKNNISAIYRCQNKDETIDMLLKIYNKQSPYVVKKEELRLR